MQRARNKRFGLLNLLAVFHMLKGNFHRMSGQHRFWLYAALGITAGITPFNFPAVVPRGYPISIVRGGIYFKTIRKRSVMQYKVG